MEKRGQFNIIGLAVILVVVLISILAIIFSDTFRFVIIGIVLLVAFFVVLSGNVIKKGQFRNFLLVALLVAGLVLLLGTGNFLQAITGERYVEVPFFATVECERGITSSFQATIPSDGDWFYRGRGLPENTDAWDIKIKTPEVSFLIGTAGKRVEYYVCNSRSFCSNRKIVDGFDRHGDTINIGKLDADKFLWIQYQQRGIFGWNADSGARLDVTYQPFSLIRDDPLRGGRQQVDSVGCEIPTSDVAWTKRIISFSGSSDIDTFSGDNKLEVGQIINYISGDIVAVSEGNLQSGGWCIYENGRANIYEIEEITYGSGSKINRVNLDNRIGSDECCNGEVYPANQICENGKFIEIEEAECSSRRDCGTLEFFATSSSQVGRYDCVNQKCEIVDVQTVECTSDQQCRTNEFCSRNTFKCVLSSEVGGVGEETQDICTTDADCLNGQVCSEGVCELTKEEAECGIFEKSVTVIEKDYGVAYWRAYTPFVDPIERQVEECRIASWVNIAVILILVGGLGAYAIFLTQNTGKRKRRGKKK